MRLATFERARSTTSRFTTRHDDTRLQLNVSPSMPNHDNSRDCPRTAASRPMPGLHQAWVGSSRLGQPSDLARAAQSVCSWVAVRLLL